MRSLILTLAFTLGCGVHQAEDTTAEKLDQAKVENPVSSVLNGSYANLYRVCDGSNKVYYAEGYNKVALFVVKDGCPNGR